MSICVFILLPSVCFRCYIYNMCILHCVHVNNSPHPSLSFPRACALEITYGMCSPRGCPLGCIYMLAVGVSPRVHVGFPGTCSSFEGVLS